MSQATGSQRSDRLQLGGLKDGLVADELNNRQNEHVCARWDATQGGV